MPRIKQIENDRDAEPAARELLHWCAAEGGPDPRMARIFVRSEVGRGFLRCWKTTLFEGLLPHRLKELVRIHMSLVEECGYCSSVRTTQGREEGVTDEVLMALPDYATSPLFGDRERAALAFADRYKQHDIDDNAVFEDLRKQFTEEEIVELGVLCLLLDGGGPWARAMQVVSWDEACSIDPVVRARAEQNVTA